MNKRIRIKMPFPIDSLETKIKLGDIYFFTVTKTNKNTTYFMNLYMSKDIVLPSIRLQYSSLDELKSDFGLKTLSVYKESLCMENVLSKYYFSDSNESLLDILMSNVKVTTKRWTEGDYHFIKFQLPSMSYMEIKLTKDDYKLMSNLVDFQSLRSKDVI